MKKRGQALVEFIIILPVFLMLVLGVIDIGKIIYNRVYLENEITDVIALYNRGKSIDEITEELDFKEDKINLTINEQEFILSKKIDIITPGLNFVFDNPYTLEISRSTS